MLISIVEYSPSTLLSVVLPKRFDEDLPCLDRLPPQFGRLTYDNAKALLQSVLEDVKTAKIDENTKIAHCPDVNKRDLMYWTREEFGSTAVSRMETYTRLLGFVEEAAAFIALHRYIVAPDIMLYH